MRHPRAPGAAAPDLRPHRRYGHFGRPPEEDGGFSWERTDLADSLARHFGASIAAA